MTTRRKFVGFSVLLFLLCSQVPGDDKPGTKTDIVKKTFDSLAAALNAQQADQVASLFTPTGEFIDGEENVFQGREAIAREFAELFKVNPRSTLQLSANDIREISPGLLTVDGGAKFTDPADADIREIEFTALLVKQGDGRWLLASIRSFGDDDDSPHAQLKRLDWMIGEWVDESDESTMHTNCRWSEDGNFIITKFEIQVAGRKVMTGTQWLGWDAALEKFRSWVFDSEGGHAEGVWTENDGRWVVKTTGVRPDGDVGSATHTYESNGPDAYVFSVTDRIIGDEEQPDFTAKVVRKPPPPATAATAPPGK